MQDVLVDKAQKTSAPALLKKQQSAAKKIYDTNKRVRSFIPSWQKEFAWVFYDATENIMYCQVCRMFAQIADAASGIVNGTGAFRKEPLTHHHTWKKHVLCQARTDNDAAPDEFPLLEAYRKYVCKVDDATQSRMERLVNTAFFINKEALAFKKFPKLCELQRKKRIGHGHDLPQ